MNKEYLSRLFKLAVPLILQYSISASLNLVGVLMIGQLGETSVAAAGLANQVYFLLTFLLFGISSGSAIFTAQFWGKGDVASIHKVLGLCLSVGLIGSLVFFLASMLFPRGIMGVYTEDPSVVALGAKYLMIIAPGFMFAAVSYSYSSVLRSTGQVRIPLLVSFISLTLNTIFSYFLIFGLAGFPKLGVYGAALGASLARVVEAGLMVFIAYRLKSPAAASFSELFRYNRLFALRVLGRALPVMFNEMLWSLGITAYNIIYAHIGTEAIAAISISSAIENLAFVIFIGISDACAVLVGNWIGANKEERAYSYAIRSLALAVSGAIAMGILVYICSGSILSLYKVSELVEQYARNILAVVAFTMWIRVSNMTLIVGIFRSGGDTRFSFVLDTSTIWLVGVPLALLGAFVLHLPVYIVYLMVMSEEAVKWLIGLWRFFSKRWINNLVQAM